MKKPFTFFPYKFGHEIIGRIDHLGTKAWEWRIGERVVDPMLWCGDDLAFFVLNQSGQNQEIKAVFALDEQ